MATRKNLSTRKKRPSKAELSRRALQGAETKRRNARERERLRKKRSEAGKLGYEKRLAKERGTHAFRVFQVAVEQNATGRLIERVRESWHAAKRELERLHTVDGYFAVLDEIADETDSEWDIAYGSVEAAA